MNNFRFKENGIYYLTIYFATAILCSCNSQKDIPKKLTVIDSLTMSFTKKYEALPNLMLKDDFKKKYLDTIRNYLRDSAHYIIGNVPVTLKELTKREIGKVNAFYVRFTDKENNEYWTEFDYPIGDDSSLQKNPAYLLLKDLPERADTCFSFFWMGDVEWGSIFTDKLNLQVMPFKKDYNYDSSKIANIKK